ncbi:hypothetical protein BJV78DRAFT_343202 [Lactifluus subvellereus]|nr:hypothetical protein BJV78DRAFT_343202 [Lactifluus subvellereus]
MSNYLSTIIRLPPVEGPRRRALSQPTTSTSSTRAYSLTSIRILNNDALLNIFYLYRLDFVDEYRSDDGDLVVGQGDQRWWYRLAQVCRLWRYLIHASPSLLDLHLVCTYGVPIADMLAHSLSLPLTIDYRERGHGITAKDEEHVLLALSWHRDRVHRIRLDLPTPNLRKLIMSMDEQFPILEYLIIDPWTKDDTCPIFPTTFQAPHLRHLVLRHAALPMGSPLLTTTGLVTLALRDIPPSAYFPPNYLLTQLSHMSQLETLEIDFHSPLSSRDVGRQLSNTPGPEAMLPNLCAFSFRGVSVYLEALLARIYTPILRRLEVNFFNQLTFVVPNLLQLMHTSENLRSSSFQIIFEKDFVGVKAAERGSLSLRGGVPPLYIRIMCRHLDWQVAATVQILSALLPVLSVVDHLNLRVCYEGDHLSSEWHHEVHRTQWRALLRPFSKVKKLHVQKQLVEELSRSLRSEDGEVPLELLPNLEALVYPAAGNAHNAATAFIDERRATGRPVSLIDPNVTCSICGKRFHAGKVLIRHMNSIHHPGNVCPYKWTSRRRRSFVQHLHQVHLIG